MTKTTMTRRQALFATAGAAAAVTIAGTTAAQAEYQPAMQAALAALGNARTSLLMATADKGGHRVVAIGMIDQAINHVNMGIQYDNVH